MPGPDFEEWQLKPVGNLTNYNNSSKLKTNYISYSNSDVNNNKLISRSIRIINDLVVSSCDESILVVDSGCDQSIVSCSSFVVGYHTGINIV